VLLAARPSVRSVHAAQDAAQKLRYELGDLSKVSVLVIGSGPYSAGEVSTALHLALGGALPEDRGAAAVLSDGATGSMPALRRSALLRAAGRIARKLTAGEQPEQAGYPAAEAAR
jgi:hypothetical protein